MPGTRRNLTPSLMLGLTANYQYASKRQIPATFVPAASRFWPARGQPPDL